VTHIVIPGAGTAGPIMANRLRRLYARDLQWPRSSSPEATMFNAINEGTLDRALRIVLGLVLLSLTFLGPKTAWGWLGIIPLVTGLVGFCPLYRILGMSTCRMRPSH
jgi:hypothetical protein